MEGESEITVNTLHTKTFLKTHCIGLQINRFYKPHPIITVMFNFHIQSLFDSQLMETRSLGRSSLLSLCFLPCILSWILEENLRWRAR